MKTRYSHPIVLVMTLIDGIAAHGLCILLYSFWHQDFKCGCSCYSCLIFFLFKAYPLWWWWLYPKYICWHYSFSILFQIHLAMLWKDDENLPLPPPPQILSNTLSSSTTASYLLSASIFTHIWSTFYFLTRMILFMFVTTCYPLAETFQGVLIYPEQNPKPYDRCCV